VVFRVEAGDHRVAARDVRHRQHACGLHEVEPTRDGEAEHAVVPLSDVVVGPEPRLDRLIGRPFRAVDAAEVLDLVEVFRVLATCEGVRGGRPEL
jgi:hypothetical protein